MPETAKQQVTETKPDPRAPHANGDKDVDPTEPAPPETPPAELQGITFHGPPAELFEALATAQGNFEEVRRNQTGQTGNRKFRYADLEKLIEATRPALKDRGLGVLQSVATDPDGKLAITTVLTHKSGAYATMCVKLDPGETSTKDGVQWCGALTTYWRRFQYRSLLCLADGEDLDSPDAPEQAAPRASQNGKARGVQVLVKPKVDLTEMHHAYLAGIGAKRQEDGVFLATVPRKRANEMQKTISWAEVKLAEEEGFTTANQKPPATARRGTPQKVK